MNDGPPKRSTASFATVTFEREFAAWLKSRASIYNLDLNDEQFDLLVKNLCEIVSHMSIADATLSIVLRHAAAIHRKHNPEKTTPPSEPFR